MSFHMLAIALTILVQVPTGSHIAISELDTNPLTWDGQMVTVTGEIVGDYGRRQNVVWVQVNDDEYSDAPLAESGQLLGQNTGMGVRMPNNLFDPTWGPPGGYRSRGPIVEVTGVFRYADAETGGDTFIEAVAVELVEESRPLPRSEPDWTLILMSTAGIAAGAAMWARARWRRLNPDG